MWSTGEGNGKPLQYSCLENPMNSLHCRRVLYCLSHQGSPVWQALAGHKRHCPEPCREGPTTARLTLGMVRGLEHCRVLLKVGKARVGEGALASASMLRVLTWTEQGASYAGGRAAWSSAGLAHPSSCGAVAAGQSSAPACCLGCGAPGSRTSWTPRSSVVQEWKNSSGPPKMREELRV